MQPSIYRNPSLDILGLRVDEPITMLTDVLVTVVCWYAFYKMSQMEKKGSIHRLCRGYFLTMGMATLLGGLIGHSFNYALGIHWKIPGWYVSMFSVAFLERASIFHAFPLIRPRLAQFFAVVNIMELLFFLVISVVTMNFLYVMGHAAYGILIVTGGFQGYALLRTRHEGSKQFLLGVLTATIGAVFFVNEWAPSMWFNHMDIAHVMMAVACWYFYLGSRKIVENPISPVAEGTKTQA